MASSSKYSVIVPTYNERENIAVCIYLIDKYMHMGCANPTAWSLCAFLCPTFPASLSHSGSSQVLDPVAELGVTEMSTLVPEF